MFNFVVAEQRALDLNLGIQVGQSLLHAGQLGCYQRWSLKADGSHKVPGARVSPGKTRHSKRPAKMSPDALS